jgi:predicted RNA binding protein YcfA (HicA-like mRNA interferase family)
MRKKTRAAIEAAQRHGFVLVRWKHHLVFRHPSGVTAVAAKSPSDNRELRNFESDLKRMLDRRD